MYLETDRQTLDDLRIFGKRDQPGLFDLYNQTHTRGGELLLREMFERPLNDFGAITDRIKTLKFFAEGELVFPFQASTFDMVEKYINPSTGGMQGEEHPFTDKEIFNGVTGVIQLLHELRAFLSQLISSKVPGLDKQLHALQELVSNPQFAPVFAQGHGSKPSYAVVTAYDRLFRFNLRSELLAILSYLFELDVFMSVAHIARQRNFCFPELAEKGTNVFAIEEVYHPELEQPVANSLSMDGEKRLVFLTGANMAGKSTFLRSVGTAVYLTHVGFPIPARRVSLSLVDGLFTTINLPDNLGIGASHFYAEVMRVKQVAQELHAGKSLFVIFDELFRGTNVKDAHEGTVEVALGFAIQPDSRFIISSHIVEAADALGQSPAIAFHYLPTRMNGTQPVYTYQLEEGVTDDRHGMLIIRNEGILEILKNGREQVITFNS